MEVSLQRPPPPLAARRQVGACDRLKQRLDNWYGPDDDLQQQQER